VRQQNFFFLSLFHPTVFDFIQTLTTLYLSRNQIGDQGAKHLSDALLHNTVRQKNFFFSLPLSHPTVFDFIQTLTTLDLRSNQIGDQGAKHLSDALLHNTVRQKNFFFFSPSFSSNCFRLHTDTHYTRPPWQSNRSSRSKTSE
jgi:hypothetical protein